MNHFAELSKNYERIEKAIYFLENNFQHQPQLDQVASAVGMSEFHFQKIFQRWAGISPKRFLQFLTKEHVKHILKESSLMDASYESGLSGSSRLHDLFISCEAMTPGEFKAKGKGLKISYGFHPTPFGECFIAVTERGICGLLFVDHSSREEILKNFMKDWQNASVLLKQKETQQYIQTIFGKSKGGIQLFCRGTNFQIKVWEALLKIPSGKTVTYKTLADSIGCPKSARAVGNAVGKNSIAYLIPCHRVIRGAGGLGGYRWGVARKRAILAKESAEHERQYE